MLKQRNVDKIHSDTVKSRQFDVTLNTMKPLFGNIYDTNELKTFFPPQWYLIFLLGASMNLESVRCAIHT